MVSLSPLQQNMDHLPVLDFQCIANLGEEMDNPAAAQAFLATYLELLPERLTYITAAVSVKDKEAALDRAVSLKVTSSMVGARQLAALSTELESLVRTAAWTSAAEALEPLGEAVQAVQRAVELQAVASAPPPACSPAVMKSFSARR